MRIRQADIDLLEGQIDMLIKRVEHNPTDPEQVSANYLRSMKQGASRIRDIAKTMERRAQEEKPVS